MSLSDTNTSSDVPLLFRASFLSIRHFELNRPFEVRSAALVSVFLALYDTYKERGVWTASWRHAALLSTPQTSNK